MSGPIVRSGPSEKYSENWEQAFGDAKPPRDAKSEKTTEEERKKKANERESSK